MPAERRIGFILPGISVSEKNKELQFTMESASTVRDVTLTLYQTVADGTTYSAWANYDPYSGSTPQEGIMLVNNNGDVFIRVISLEDGDIGDTYNVTISTSAVEENFKSAVETVLADNGFINATETLFDGTITITTENVEIPFNRDVSSYPFKNWTVTINGLEIPYQENENGFMLDVDDISYGVLNDDGVYVLSVVNIQDKSYPPVPGDYQVKIVGVSESGGGSGLPDVTEDDEGKQLTVVKGEWSKNGYIYETIDRQDTSVSPNKTYVVLFHRQGKLVRVNCNAIPMSLFTDIVIPQGYRPADAYDGVRQLILNVDDNSVEWVQFDGSTNKFNYFGSSTGKFLIDFTYFTYNAFPTE